MRFYDYFVLKDSE